MADHQPYVAPSQSMAELTPRALVLGVVLGLIFGASNVYLALKIGLTVSASIPIAVLAITIFRTLGRSTILENNIVQTTGSAGDSIAAGVVFTIPAILLMGYDLDIGRVAILAIAGGLIGVLMMIPLRRALIVKEHGNLTYPEGTACAEVLIAGEKGGVHAKTVFQAFGLAFVYKFAMTALKLWKESPGRVFRSYQAPTIAVEVSPELLGVGYIIGPRIAGYLFAGGSLAYLVLMPAIKLFGSAMNAPIFGTTKLIKDMSAGEVRSTYVFYIGAGAVATAGIIALAPLPADHRQRVSRRFRRHESEPRGHRPSTRLRTDDDLPICRHRVRLGRAGAGARLPASDRREPAGCASSSSSSASSSRPCRRASAARSALGQPDLGHDHRLADRDLARSSCCSAGPRSTIACAPSRSPA